MRHLSLAFLVAVAAYAATLAAQGGGGARAAGSVITVTGSNGPIDGAEMRLFQNGRVQVLGASIGGKFTLNQSLLSGKPQIDVRVDKCPNRAAPTFTFYVSGPASAAAESDFKGTENCGHDKILVAFYWGSNWSYKVKPTAGDSGKPFYKNPLYDALIAGGTVAGVYVATRDSGTDNGNGNGNGTSNDFGFTDANGSYSGTLTKQSDTGCNFSNTAPVTGTLTLNSNGTGTWVKTHTSASQTFSFSISASKDSSGISYTGTPITNRAIGAGTYTVTDAGTITKSSSFSITITQTFTGTNGTACTVVYKGTVTKQ